MNSKDRALVLVIGGSGTGKTHYGAQLLERLKHRSGHLRLRGAVQNALPFELALARLGQGLASDHTPRDVYDVVDLEVQDAASSEINLTWPDYGGEQVTNLLETRRLSVGWRERVLQSNSWLFLIRLNSLRIDEDILSRPTASVKEEDLKPVLWSAQAQLIELLQMLLYAKHVGMLRRVAVPKIAVMLSCWDEMGQIDQETSPPA